MKLNALVPMMATENLDGTVAFYRDTLGFRSLSQSPEWACVELDGVEIMFSLPNAHEPFTKPLFTGSFYFRVDNVDRFWAQLKDRATVVYPIEDFPYGMREFAIRDNNGYILQFGSEI